MNRSKKKYRTSKYLELEKLLQYLSGIFFWKVDVIELIGIIYLTDFNIYSI